MCCLALGYARLEEYFDYILEARIGPFSEILIFKTGLIEEWHLCKRRNGQIGGVFFLVV